MPRTCCLVAAALSALCLLLLLLLLSPALAEAHPRSVGLLQVQITEDGARVLLKLDAELLYEALALGDPASWDAAVFETPQARGRVMHYLAERLRVESAHGLCERDRIELYGLTPSRQRLDVILIFRCTLPRQYVQITATPLLDDAGHYLNGAFSHGGEVERRLVKRSSAPLRFSTPEDRPVEEEPPRLAEAPAEAPLSERAPWAIGGALALLTLLVEGPRRTRLAVSAGSFAIFIATAAIVLILRPMLAEGAAALSAAAAWIGLGAASALAALSKAPPRLALLLPGGIAALLGGLAAGAVGWSWLGGASAALPALAMLVAIALDTRPDQRLRRTLGLALVALAAFFTLSALATLAESALPRAKACLPAPPASGSQPAQAAHPPRRATPTRRPTPERRDDAAKEQAHGGLSRRITHAGAELDPDRS